jgi:hypothetical protein
MWPETRTRPVFKEGSGDFVFFFLFFFFFLFREAVQIVNPDQSSGWSQIKNGGGLIGWVPSGLLYADYGKKKKEKKVKTRC